MSNAGPGIEKVQLIDSAGAPIGVTGNPLVSSSSGGGGGTVTQGPAGSALQSWYMRDGSGLLATSAQQVDGTQLTKIWGESGVAANTLPVNSYVTPDYSSVVATLSHGNAATRAQVNTFSCSSADRIFSDDPTQKFRKVYNPSVNGFLCIRYGDSSVTGELDCTLMVKPGDSWTMPTIGGAPEFSGEVWAISTNAVHDIITTFGFN